MITAKIAISSAGTRKAARQPRLISSALATHLAPAAPSWKLVAQMPMTLPRWWRENQGCMALTLLGQPVDWKKPLAPAHRAKTSASELEPKINAVTPEAIMPKVSMRRGP